MALYSGHIPVGFGGITGSILGQRLGYYVVVSSVSQQELRRQVGNQVSGLGAIGNRTRGQAQAPGIPWASTARCSLLFAPDPTVRPQRILIWVESIIRHSKSRLPKSASITWSRPGRCSSSPHSPVAGPHPQKPSFEAGAAAVRNVVPCRSYLHPWAITTNLKITTFPAFPPGVRVGEFLFVSGQIAQGDDGQLVGEGDCAAQTRQVMACIRTIVEAAGATMQDV